VASSCYVVDYAGRFNFSAPPEEVWSAMEEFDQFERWWRWLGNLTVQGGGLRAGAVLHGTVDPPVPYRMQVRVDVDRCVPARLIDAAVHGDLEGEAHVALEPERGGTRADVAWKIEMMQRPMRLAARVAYPMLRWGHDRVVEATLNGFRAHMEETHGRGDGGPADPFMG
jgi:uncharacterized protein YndB with AHSA1/START domain